MLLTIVLRKEVPDPESGEFLYNLVKERLNDHPEVEVKGHITNHFGEEEEP
ncbi:hypothetical protein ES703_57513 [subsurface metagenome]